MQGQDREEGREGGVDLCLDAHHLLDDYGQKICIFCQQFMMTGCENCRSALTSE